MLANKIEHLNFEKNPEFMKKDILVNEMSGSKKFLYRKQKLVYAYNLMLKVDK